MLIRTYSKIINTHAYGEMGLKRFRHGIIFQKTIVIMFHCFDLLFFVPEFKTVLEPQQTLPSPSENISGIKRKLNGFWKVHIPQGCRVYSFFPPISFQSPSKFRFGSAVLRRVCSC